MKISVWNGSITEAAADLIVVNLCQGGAKAARRWCSTAAAHSPDTVQALLAEGRALADAAGV
ncbi:MAG: hypothetical protein CVU38_19770 [Chloroflexi bacterium HGW-Chloroflexi-1]|nr:MAG: hypothetical protein CVU38_19770 [Chloroflexi bacterium HGW-Chloroflexi-1]